MKLSTINTIAEITLVLNKTPGDSDFSRITWALDQIQFDYKKDELSIIEIQSDSIFKELSEIQLLALHGIAARLKYKKLIMGYQKE